jgi:hypothetical protein
MGAVIILPDGILYKANGAQGEDGREMESNLYLDIVWLLKKTFVKIKI